jgi:hypothetical protein
LRNVPVAVGRFVVTRPRSALCPMPIATRGGRTAASLRANSMAERTDASAVASTTRSYALRRRPRVWSSSSVITSRRCAAQPARRLAHRRRRIGHIGQIRSSRAPARFTMPRRSPDARKYDLPSKSILTLIDRIHEQDPLLQVTTYFYVCAPPSRSALPKVRVKARRERGG